MMKRLLAALLTSCMIAGLTTPAGAGVLTEIRANTEAALRNMRAEEDRTEIAGEGAGSFDQAISDLYDNSMSATDEEVLASARKMNSDFDAVEKRLGDKASGLIEYLKYYETVKSSYMTGSQDDLREFSDGIISEWDRQGKYTSYVMPASDEVHTLVPRIKVTDCSATDDSASLTIYEWMTVGYAPADSEEVNATAYGYSFSLHVDRDRKGNWSVSSVEDTDQNFDWMKEEAEYAAESENSGQDGQRVFSGDGSLEMMAASAAASYTYNVSKALEYADKYCINYNSAYNSYKGRGGDCANFVSQCLYAGGFKQDSVWYRHSVAWINVMKQIAHFKEYGKFLNANNGNLLRGNPIYFDWNGDGVYDHATICVGRNNSGIAILDSHTKDLYHATWTNWSFKKAATIQLRGSGSSTATQDGAFKTDKTGKYYEYSDGTRLRACFRKIGGKTYYFKKNGYVAKGLTVINGTTYIFNPSTGEMYRGWTTYKGNKYYLGTNGKACTEWNEIDGSWYYFVPDTCVMVKGFYTVKGKLHYFNRNGVEQFGWITVSGKKYHLDEWGVVQYGWQKIEKKKYYFDQQGVMVTGKVKIEGILYTFDEKGVLTERTIGGITQSIISPNAPTSVKKTGKTGWVSKNGNWYYFRNGEMLKGCWLRLGTGNSNTYYLSIKDGVMLKGWNTINGKKYYFDSNGVMVTGQQVINGTTYHFSDSGVLQ